MIFVASADPFLATLSALRTGENAYGLKSINDDADDATLDAFAAEHIAPHRERILAGEVQVTSLVGVREALRTAIPEIIGDTLERRLLLSSFRFLEREAQEAAEPDPFLARMERYRSEVDAFNRALENDDNAQDPIDQFEAELQAGEIAIGSPAGAIAAIRRVFDIDCIIDTEGEIMLRAVVAFLEARA